MDWSLAVWTGEHRRRKTEGDDCLMISQRRDPPNEPENLGESLANSSEAVVCTSPHSYFKSNTDRC